MIVGLSRQVVSFIEKMGKKGADVFSAAVREKQIRPQSLFKTGIYDASH